MKYFLLYDLSEFLQAERDNFYKFSNALRS